MLQSVNLVYSPVYKFAPTEATEERMEHHTVLAVTDWKTALQQNLERDYAIGWGKAPALAVPALCCSSPGHNTQSLGKGTSEHIFFISRE